MRRTGWRKTPDLSDRMEWQHADEQTVLTWTVKAIDRNILCSGLPSLISGGIALLLGICFLWVDIVLASAMFFGAAVAAFLFYKIGMEKTVFVYRATEQRLEVCQWQDIPDLVFTLLRIFPFIGVGVILMAFVSSPGLSIAALVGPALVGILIASVGSDSNYKTIYKKFRQHDFLWVNLDRVMLDKQKGLLALSVSSPDDVIQDEEIDFDNPEDHRYLMRVYFDSEQEEAVLRLFRDKSPHRASIVDGSYKYFFAG